MKTHYKVIIVVKQGADDGEIFVRFTGISWRARAVICERGVDTRAAMLTCDVTAVVNVDVTCVSAESSVTETHRPFIVQDTARSVYSTG